jgi:hypothetical protein
MALRAQGGAWLRVAAAVAVLPWLPAARAQALLHQAGPGAVRVLPTDMAVLEIQEPRKDLACTVDPIKPTLGFDLRFHSGYNITIPLKELAGAENLLTMVFRVTPEGEKAKAAYFVQTIKVPHISEDATGDAYLEGYFDVGEGKYHVDWLMRDRTDRLCSSYWDTEARLSDRDKTLPLRIAAGAIQEAEQETFRPEPPVQRARSEGLLKVKILINFAPQKENAAAFSDEDTSALVAILRTIAREPRFGTFSVIAFNLRERRVFYRQDDASQIDFPALGEAIHTLNLGTIDLKLLAQKNGETEFLANLIQREAGGKDQPDALIFAGPKTLLDDSVPADSLREVGDVAYPVFYMNCNLEPQNTPWRDAIGRAVRFFKGSEYTISRPRDLWTAITEIVSKTVTFKREKQAAVPASR